MYAKEYMNEVTKDKVQHAVYMMFKSRCFYSFFIIKCKKCGRSVISLHVEHIDGGDAIAYFICGKCGKKVAKKSFISGFKVEGVKAHYTMKQYEPINLIYKKEEYRGVRLTSKKVLLIMEDKNLVVSSDDIREIHWTKSKYQSSKAD